MSTEEAFARLVDRYKLHLQETGINDEIYKWETVKHFQETFDLDAEDFAENIKQTVSKAGNLLYHNSKGFIKKAARYFPEKVKEMFEVLYDESKPLKERIGKFVALSEELEPDVSEKMGKPLNHQQDERTISFYLTMRFPEKYPLYKSDTYQYLLSFVNEADSRKAGEKLFHYLELTSDLVAFVENDSDLIEEVRSLLTEKCYNGGQKWLILQDILWVNKRVETNTNYWIFQGSPDVFDVVKSLKDGVLKTWSVKAHKSKITTGDKVILWLTGKEGGCYALAEVESDVFQSSVSEEESFYYKEPPSEPYDQVELRITHNLAENPITTEMIDGLQALSALKAGNQGTNFSATEEQYEALKEMAENKSGGDSKWADLVLMVQKINDEKAVRKFFDVLRFVLKKLGTDGKEEKIYSASIDKRIQLTVGGKYVSRIGVKKGKVIIGFYILKKDLEDLKIKYPNLENNDSTGFKNENIVWVNLPAKDVAVEDFYMSTFLVAEQSYTGQTKSQFRATYAHIHNPWVAKVALDKNLLEKLLKGESMDEVIPKQPEITHPLNTIFYGPPGTGKTYNTIKRAAEIVDGREIEDYREAKSVFEVNLRDSIEFITFHQNYSYEDFIEGLRPDTENNQQLTFDRADGIFKRMANKALKNLKESSQTRTKKKTFEEVFKEFISPLNKGEVEEIEVEMKRVSYFITAVTERSIQFRKASGGTSHSMSINTLRKMYEAESDMEMQGLSSYYTPLLDILLDLGKSPGETEIIRRKNYVLIIDEINRANISRVFGELITLIEPDKRYGREMHIPATLPSGESFSVPENLYLIGTMNTADKSIALLDIALRRRFEFEAMYPKYEINGEVIYDVDVFKKINERIVKLKGHDFQIGHSYFMKNDITLEQRMNRKVIPLLLEYFMNDEKEVKDILTYAGLNLVKDSWPLEISGRS